MFSPDPMFDDIGRAKGSKMTVIPKIKPTEGAVNDKRMKQGWEKVGAQRDKEWCDSLSWWPPALNGIWILEGGSARTHESILL